MLPKILLGIGVILIIGIGIYSWHTSSASVEEVIAEGAQHPIVLTRDGYSPRELTIKKGDVVTFTTTRGFEHWPASDVHPTHNMYAAFDPKRPLPANEPWSFQFTKAGEWTFHDHLNSTFTGTITVTE